MEHYITEIKIDKLRHLSNISINLNTQNRQHLMITGKNGAGKTSLLLALQKYLQSVNDKQLTDLCKIYQPYAKKAEEQITQAQTEAEKFRIQQDNSHWISSVKKYVDGVEPSFNRYEEIDALYAKGSFITAYFPADRKTQMIRVNGVENVKLNQTYDIRSNPGKLLLKYMVHLKTQQLYARNEGDMETADRIQKWFDRFESALRVLLDDDTASLKYYYKEYDFRISENGRAPFGFDELSDGYSSVIHMVSDLILRMDQNWLLGNGLSEYDLEGIVLIDELETHLHIELQKKILPFLVKFFPRIQFIVTTHSPYILNSISNAKAYDLERCVELENLSVYSSDELADGYFGADEYSNELKEEISRYEYLKSKENLTEDERAEKAKLRCRLKAIPREFLPEVRDKFEEIEGYNYDKG